MDYRHTEGYARQMEAAGLRAQQLRRDAMDRFWTDIGRWLRRVWHNLAGS
jgi:hypothetical protein